MGWSQGAPLGEVEGRGRARNGAAVCESGHIQGAGDGGIAELFRYKFKSLHHLQVETTTHTSQKGHHIIQSLQMTKAGAGVEEKEPSHTLGGNVSWCSHCGEQYGGSLKKLNIGLPWDPAIPLLGVYPEKTLIRKGTCTPILIAALFTVAKT